MNSKKMVAATFSLLLSALLLIGTVNFAVDPLFQYHKPWFGLEANVTNERYQNAGIAKNFDFKNVIIGNSMSENFLVSDVEKAFNGKTVKLTASGSYALDWTYLLDILSGRENHPENILFNLDTGFFNSSDKVTKHEMPLYLYDNNYLNDVEYLFNFALTNYTYDTLKANIHNTVPDYNSVFVWGYDIPSEKDIVLTEYNAAKEKNGSAKTDRCFYTEGNLKLLGKYFEAMPDTQFVFFCSPFSVLYWKDVYDSGQLDEYKAEFEKTFDFMSQYKNVTVFFWVDEEMLDIISNLDNYKDSTHYGFHISKEIISRLDNNFGVLPKEKENYKSLLNVFFDYLENFDYEKLFD